MKSARLSHLSFNGRPSKDIPIVIRGEITVNSVVWARSRTIALIFTKVDILTRGLNSLSICTSNYVCYCEKRLRCEHRKRGLSYKQDSSIDHRIESNIIYVNSTVTCIIKRCLWLLNKEKVFTSASRLIHHFSAHIRVRDHSIDIYSPLLIDSLWILSHFSDTNARDSGHKSRSNIVRRRARRGFTTRVVSLSQLRVGPRFEPRVRNNESILFIWKQNFRG